MSPPGGMMVVNGCESRCSDGIVVGISSASDTNFGIVSGSVI